jgi:Sulfotransferase family
MSAKRSVIVITYGRTGSTLLVGLLNTAEKTLIRGENGNFFFHLFKAYDTLIQTRRRGGTTPNHPFFGIKEADVDGFLDLCRQSVTKVLAPGGSRWRAGPSTIGFKEIRYLNMPESDLSEYLDFLNMIFPDPLFVFLTRDHEQVLSSGFYQRKKNKDKIAEQLKECDQIFEKVAANKKNSFEITYRDLADGDRLRALFAAAGLTYDPEKIRAVLKIDHSPQTPKHLKKRTWPADDDGDDTAADEEASPA